MGKLKDDPKSRLERLARTVLKRTAMDQLQEAFGQTVRSLKRPAWENEALRDSQMQALSALDPSFNTKTEQPLKIAFETFGLSPDKPQDWRTLLIYFAFAHFSPKTRASGRPHKWTGERLCQLLYDVAARRRGSPYIKSNTQIYSLLIRDRKLKSRYRDESTNSLKAAYKLTKDPIRNEVLALIQDEHEHVHQVSIKQAIEITGIDLSEKDFRIHIPSLALKSAIELIETDWPTLFKAMKNKD